MKATLILSAILLTSASLSFANTTWDGSESADWFDADNWSAGVPDSSDITFIGASPFPDIDGSGNNAVAQRVLVGDGSSAILDIRNGATLSTTQFSNAPSYLGYGAVGFLDLDGAGSRWDIAGQAPGLTPGDTAIRIGYDIGSPSRGKLTIQNNAHLDISGGAGIRLWSWDLGGGNFSRSSVVIGDGAAAGTLAAGWIEGDAGSSADSDLIFSHTSSGYHFTSDGSVSGDAVDIRGEIRLYQTGSGETFLTGNNTYTGGTNLRNGTLVVSSNSNLGANSSDIVFGGSSTSGTLRAIASFTNEHDLDFSDSDGTIAVDHRETLSQNGAVSGDQGLTKTGPGGLELLNDLPGFTGAITVEDGLLIQHGTLGTPVITVEAGAVYQNHQLGIPASLRPVPHDFLGGGEIRFDGFNRFSGDLSGFAGKLTTHNSIFLGNGTLNWGPWPVDVEITGGPTQRVVFDQSGEFEITGDITGSGGLNLYSADVIRLSGDNRYTGQTLISGDGAELILSGDMGPTPFALNLSTGGSAAITIDTDSKITIQSLLRADSNVAFTKTGIGSAILTGDNDIHHFVISEGTISVADGGDLGGGTVTNDGAVSFEGAGLKLANEDIGGTGTVGKAGIGTTMLTGANTYTGDTTIVAGTLQVGDGSSSSGTLGTGPVSIGSNGTLAFRHDGSGGIKTIGNPLTGTGNLNLLGSGEYAFTGTDSFSGTLRIGGDTRLSLEDLAGDVVVETGTLDPAPSAATSVMIDGEYTQENDGTLKIEIGGTAAGSEYDVVNVAGTATLDGSIDVSFISGYSPSGAAVVFEILNCGALIDNGINVNLPSVPYYQSETHLTETGLRVIYYETAVDGFRAKYGLNLDGSDDFGDWSRNGTENILYFFYGLGDPNAVFVPQLSYDGEEPTPGLPLFVDHGDGTCTYSFTWRLGTYDFSPTCQSSTDLSTWDDVLGAGAPIQPVGSSVEPIGGAYVIQHYEFDLSGEEKAFFRTRIESAE